MLCLGYDWTAGKSLWTDLDSVDAYSGIMPDYALYIEFITGIIPLQFIQIHAEQKVYTKILQFIFNRIHKNSINFADH